MVAELLPGYAGSSAVRYANTFERLPTGGTTHLGQQIEYRPGNFFRCGHNRWHAIYCGRLDQCIAIGSQFDGSG